MKFTLQELLEQKTLLEKQLELINSRIGEIRDGGSSSQPQHSPAPSIQQQTVVSPPPEKTAPETTIATPARQPQAPAQIAAEAKEFPATHDPDIQAYSGSQMNLADTRKGCMIWAAIFIGIAIAIAILTYNFYPRWDEETAKEKFKDLPKKEQTIDR